jgi:hypothetical protein
MKTILEWLSSTILGFWASVEVLRIGALRRRRLGTMTYYVALAFKRSEENGDIVACEPKEARSADQAIRMAGSLAAAEGHCGAIAFSRTGDPALGEFEDAVILKTVGEVDVGLLTV